MDPTRLSAIRQRPCRHRLDDRFRREVRAVRLSRQPAPESLRAGQVVDAQHVMVEVNTVFEQLTSVLSKIDPAKLNETLGAIASAVNGRGEKIGQMLSDLDSYLAKIEPSLPALSHDLEAPPTYCVHTPMRRPDSSRSPTTARGSATLCRPGTESRRGPGQRDRPGRRRQ